MTEDETRILRHWFVFALLYFVVAETRGDLNEVEIGKKEIPCVEGATDFLEMFMFSMETQSTIGYGTRYVTNECPTAVILVIIQSILGSFLHAVLTGVVLFKFQEPKKRAHTVLFSNVACVIEDDGKYFIEVQILNMQRSQLINPDVGAFCVMNHPDGSGKCRLDVDFKPCQENARLFFRPRIYRHLIDQQSPFWEFERKDFECGNYELIVAISGVDEITDTFAQARTSFLPSEVVWGRNFKQMTATREGKRFKLNFNDFTRTHRLQRCMADSSASMASRNVSLTKTVEE
ncbi:ATP-sensitive inward rectifier potassium channel 1-like [Dreissena polymorpha]|uniref:ATP-sensitive inward rectifier potassium channel 1-like n=1 Tax=Dreissena polymorpha TaxID=45954 RepID=UPI0022647888|nr:ATP-sensitive inward rectifier potassium channel 1-like [Dreissena polymorpha]